MLRRSCRGRESFGGGGAGRTASRHAWSGARRSASAPDRSPQAGLRGLIRPGPGRLPAVAHGRRSGAEGRRFTFQGDLTGVVCPPEPGACRETLAAKPAATGVGRTSLPRRNPDPVERRATPRSPPCPSPLPTLCAPPSKSPDWPIDRPQPGGLLRKRSRKPGNARRPVTKRSVPPVNSLVAQPAIDRRPRPQHVTAGRG